MPIDDTAEFKPIRIAVLSVSDSRTRETDKSGGYLCAALQDLGHILADYAIVPDDQGAILGRLHQWIDDQSLHCVLITGGTGVTGRDVTPEALAVLNGKEIPGFGELFRWISYRTIGTATIQSRAIAYIVRSTYIFAMPGATSACEDAWEHILVHQLDSRFKPCNFVELIGRLRDV